MYTRNNVGITTAQTTKPVYWDALIEYLESADHEQTYPRFLDSMIEDFLIYCRHAHPDIVEQCPWCATTIFVGDFNRHMVLVHGPEL